ncbi:MAG: hypothetical protein ACLSEX_06445, partial [Blautia sp.]
AGRRSLPAGTAEVQEETSRRGEARELEGEACQRALRRCKRRQEKGKAREWEDLLFGSYTF